MAPVLAALQARQCSHRGASGRQKQGPRVALVQGHAWVTPQPSTGWSGVRGREVGRQWRRLWSLRSVVGRAVEALQVCLRKSIDSSWGLSHTAQERSGHAVATEA
jgi:hypothetical protein